MQELLVAVDGSEVSQRTLEFACELAARFEAKLHLIHVPQGVAKNRVMYMGGSAIVVRASCDEIEAAGRSVLDSATETASSLGVQPSSIELKAGDPAEEIVKQAKNLGVDAIVIGNRGLGGFRGLLLGSVSTKVNHAAKCTCITVH